MKVKIYGAGSIGNHLGHACRNKGWDVLMCDSDPTALKRTKQDIYPSRYGTWDEAIRLVTPDQLPDEDFDLVIIGTPPDTHLAIAKSVLETRPPKAMLVEKPVCTPSLEGAQQVLDLANGAGTVACVGYNHTLTANTVYAEHCLTERLIGKPLSLSVRFREHWGGIFKAHPWLAGPQDSYLGYWKRGGGTCGEHSHAINLWQHFATHCGLGRIVEVSATMDMVKENGAEYDRIALLNVMTETGEVGDIAQDVITEPAQKQMRIQGSKGYLEWYCNIESGYDAVFKGVDGDEPEKKMIAKTRPDDFKNEIDHLEKILNGTLDHDDSPIALECGLDTMLVVAAAYLSSQKKRAVRINYKAGYCREALEVI